jgi:hypothetical protein
LFHFHLSPLCSRTRNEWRRKEYFWPMKLFKISLKIGGVVKVKKLFDFFIGAIYNLGKEANSLTC